MASSSSGSSSMYKIEKKDKRLFVNAGASFRGLFTRRSKRSKKKSVDGTQVCHLWIECRCGEGDTRGTEWRKSSWLSCVVHWPNFGPVGPLVQSPVFVYTQLREEREESYLSSYWVVSKVLIRFQVCRLFNSEVQLVRLTVLRWSRINFQFLVPACYVIVE